MYDHQNVDTTKDASAPASERPARKQAPAASQAKLVLLFFILVVGMYTVIIQHRFHLPDAEGSNRTHRKHLRLEQSNLRSQFQSHRMGSNGQQPGVQAPAGGLADKASHLASVITGLHSKAQSRGDSSINRQRAAAVKAAMVHAWTGYETYAWGMDELMPAQQSGKQSFAGMAATLLDSLSTLWLMDLKSEFGRARDWVAANLTFTTTQEISLFETNIRVVGGLLSAYDLSGDEVFLRRVTELVDLMLPAMEGFDTGIPANSIVLGRPSNSFRSTAALAECGSLQLEWTALSLRSGNSIYSEKSQKVFRALHAAYPDQGLIPTTVNRHSGKGGPSFSIGAMADSYYEYLLKLWLLEGQKEDLWRSMWEKAVDDTLSQLLGHTKASNLSWLGVSSYGNLEEKQEHLACFFPGNMALGVYTGAVTGAKAERYLQVAKDVTYTCWQMYERMPSGLSPEVAVMFETEDVESEMSPQPSYNILRPETVESFYYLWRVTGDPQYREWGWEVFEAFEKYCKVENGYVGTPDVTRVPPIHDDTMQSFFLAETLKYLYLLFSDEDVLQLDEWVFNTEAHPLRLPKGVRSQRKNQQKGLRQKAFAGLLNQT